MYSTLSTWKTRLAQGLPPIETTAEWQQILTAVQLHCKQPKSYVLSADTGLIEPDSSVLLEAKVPEPSIKVFNEFITNLMALSEHLMRQLNLTTDSNQLLVCLMSAQSLTIKKLEHSARGYRCVFTGVISPSNLSVQIVYRQNRNYHKSPPFSVSETHTTWLQALYMMRNFTTELLNRIDTDNTKFFSNMNAAIQWAWELCFPLATNVSA